MVSEAISEHKNSDSDSENIGKVSEDEKKWEPRERSWYLDPLEMPQAIKRGMNYWCEDVTLE